MNAIEKICTLCQAKISEQEKYEPILLVCEKCLDELLNEKVINERE